MIEKIIIEIVTRLVSWLYARGLVAVKEAQAKKEAEADIDARLEKFNEAFKGAFNGEPVTDEERKRLNQAAADFIRGSSSRGL